MKINLRVIHFLLCLCLTSVSAVAQRFYNLTSDEVRVDSIMPLFSHNEALPANYRDSVYSVDIAYPEYADMPSADIANYRRLTNVLPPDTQNRGCRNHSSCRPLHPQQHTRPRQVGKDSRGYRRHLPTHRRSDTTGGICRPIESENLWLWRQPTERDAHRRRPHQLRRPARAAHTENWRQEAVLRPRTSVVEG